MPSPEAVALLGDLREWGVEIIASDGRLRFRSTEAVTPTIEMFFGTPTQSGGRFWLVGIILIFCGAVVFWIRYARSGKPIKVRKIAGLEAFDEAVGRATEMGTGNCT